jgi:thioredoxin 1
MIIDVTSVAQLREIIKSPEYSLVDFHADWSGPSHLMEQLINELSDEVGKVRFYKVDVVAQEEISKFVGGVHIMPTIFVYKSGTTVNTMAGANPDGLRTMVKNLSQ